MRNAVSGISCLKLLLNKFEITVCSFVALVVALYEFGLIIIKNYLVESCKLD